MLASQESTIVWGFMLENTLFTQFEDHNHALIEAAYRQRKSKKSSHYIHIIDMNLPKPYKAKVYFGVAQNHLRMPGTRYYVTRKVLNNNNKPGPAVLPPFHVDSAASATATSASSLIQQPFLMPTPFYNYGNQTTTTNELEDLLGLLASSYQDYLFASHLLFPFDLSYTPF